MGTTIPEFASIERVPLDKLRKLIRRSEALRNLLRSVGPLRVIPAPHLAAFRSAVRTALKETGHWPRS